MTQDRIAFFEGTWLERVFVAVACPLLGVLGVGGLISIEAAFPWPSTGDWPIRIAGIAAHVMWSELFIAFLAFLSLAFLWAILKLRWIERCLLWARDHVWSALCLFLGGFLVIVLIACIVTW